MSTNQKPECVHVTLYRENPDWKTIKKCVLTSLRLCGYTVATGPVTKFAEPLPGVVHVFEWRKMDSVHLMWTTNPGVTRPVDPRVTSLGMGRVIGRN